MRQSRREIHPSTGRTRLPVLWHGRPAAGTSLRRAQRARSRSPTWTCPHSPSLPTKRAGCRATRERKPLRRSRSGVWPWLFVTSQRGHTPPRHHRPSHIVPCPPPRKTPRNSERGVFTGSEATHRVPPPGRRPQAAIASHAVGIAVPCPPHRQARRPVCRCRNPAAFKTKPTTTLKRSPSAL